MSQQSYEIKGSVADADFLSDTISQDWERSYLSITFYSDSEFTIPVTPTAGTVTITATDDGYNYGTVANGTVDVTTQEYDRPTASGRIVNFKATLSGVTGASYFKVVANQYN